MLRGWNAWSAVHSIVHLALGEAVHKGGNAIVAGSAWRKLGYNIEGLRTISFTQQRL